MSDPKTGLRPDSSGPYRLLVVDDNPSIHDDFRRIFTPDRDATPELDELASSVFGISSSPSQSAHTLDHVTQGQDALDRVIAARDAGRPYALVFMDVRMPPGWDGVEACHRVMDADRDVHVVLCTAYPERDWRRRVDGLPSRDRVLVLKKPFDIAEIRQLANALCERWTFARRDRARMRDLEHSVSEQRGRLADAATHLRNEIASRTLAEQQLDKARQLEGLGRLAAGMCHEISNPLSYIITSAELIEQELGDLAGHIPQGPLAELAELTGTISAGANRITRIVRNIKMFARNSESRTEPIELEHAAESAMGMLRSQLLPHMELQVDVTNTTMVEGRRLELEQVLINLVENALHAMGDQQEPPPRVLITTRRRNDSMCIDVTDNGPGIDEAIFDKIFDPFFTTKSIGKGTGLGLSICHNLIRGMSGSIGVSNNDQRGATFTITLPLAHSAVAEIPSKTPPPSTMRTGRVLVLDDEPLMLATLERALKPHAVSTATNVQDALTLCGSEAFDVIFCDIMMPGLDGRDFHRMLAQLRPGEEDRVVFITGGGLHQSVREFLEQTSNRCLDKPLDSDELRTIIAEALQHARDP